MPDVATAIVSLIHESGPVTSQIGGRLNAVGLPDLMPRPNIVYQIIDTSRVYSNDGPTGLKRAMVQLTCYADTYPAAKSLAAAVATVFDGYVGTAPDGTVIQSTFIDDERDAPAPPPEGQSRGAAGVLLVLLIAYSG